MEVKKGYKQTELGVIPEDWDLIKMSTIGDTLIGLTYSPINVKESGTLVLRSSNVQNMKLSFKDNVFVDMELPDRVIVKENDLLICVRNGSRQLIGKCALIDKQASGSAFGAFMTIYRSNHNKFVFYQFQSKIIQEQINETLGATINQLTNRDLSVFKIFKPRNIVEETQITQTLSDADLYITSLEKLIEKKKAIKQGAMQELLKPKDGWEERLLTDIVDFTHGKAHEQFIVEDGTFCVVNSKFISTEGKVAKFSNQSFLTAKKNDILTVLSDLPNGKALAKCFFVERNNYYAVNQRICIWRSKNADSKFLYYLLNRHPYFLALNDGVSQTHILNHHIKKCRINIPLNKSEQENIGEILSSIDKELAVLESKLEKAKSIKEGMMQNLLTGKIRLI